MGFSWQPGRDGGPPHRSTVPWSAGWMQRGSSAYLGPKLLTGGAGRDLLQKNEGTHVC